MIRKTLKEIASLVGGEIVGNQEVVINGVAGIREAGPGEITFLANPKYLGLLETCAAAAIVTSKEIKSCLKPIIRTENPSLAFVKIVALFSQDRQIHFSGIHPSVILGKGVSLGKDVAIAPYTVLADRVVIGDRSVVYSGVFIGERSKIGSDCLIYSNVSIRENSSIGSRVIIHSGAVIGSDGFGFIPVEGRQYKIPQVGFVEIGDDVEIGANTAIDRARFDKTVIGSATKIDNLVHIAHNVVVGENCIIVAQAGISGSTTIGRGATLAGQAGLVGHINIGEGAIVAAQAGVTKSVPANTVVSGYPAQEHSVAKRVNACVQNLPRLYDSVKKLQKKIEELESKLK